MLKASHILGENEHTQVSDEKGDHYDPGGSNYSSLSSSRKCNTGCAGVGGVVSTHLRSGRQ